MVSPNQLKEEYSYDELHEIITRRIGDLRDYSMNDLCRLAVMVGIEGKAEGLPKKIETKRKWVPKPDSDANECILFSYVKKDGSKGSDANYLNISNHKEFKTFLKGLNLKWKVSVRSTDPNIKGGWELPKDLTVSKLRAEIAEAWPEWSFEDTRFHNRSARVICRFFRQMRLRQLSILSKSHRDFYTSSPTDVLCEIRGFI